MRIRAVFFDLDDTLCNYMQVADRARKWVFHMAAKAYEELSADDLEAAWHAEFNTFLPEVRPGGVWRQRYLISGETTRTELMRRALARLGVDDTKLAAYLSDGYYVERQERLELYSDAEEVLTRLGKKMPIGMITNGPADTQREEVDRLGIGRHFKKIFIEGEFGVGKPDPIVFRAAADSVGQPPSEVALVGNSLKHDIHGAKNVGMITCWLPQGEEAGHPLEGEADLIAANLTEVADWIEGRIA